MAVQLEKVLYTAEAVVEGGRQGHGRTSDGRLEVDLSEHKGVVRFPAAVVTLESTEDALEVAIEGEAS